MNIKQWRRDIKAIVANDYYDAAVKVKANGDVILHNYAAGIESFEGNLKDREVQERWSRYCVERMVGPDIEFESWLFHTKPKAMEKLVELIKEDNGGQINLLDFGHVPNRAIRVSCGENLHLIEIMSHFVKKRDFHMLRKVQQELQNRRAGYKTVECKMVQEW